ncbi:MAG: hypothetical protein ACRDKS_08425, partial [Actinomycetota bacterium]
MKVVADTGPLLAAANSRDKAHALASALITELGRSLVVLDTVSVEADHLFRSRISPHAARLFLRSLVEGELSVAFLSPGLLRRADEI